MPNTVDAHGVIGHLPAYNEQTHAVQVVIETPKGSRNKFKYDLEYGLFELSGVLPAGAVFPFDFGFIPSTLGDDGDPLDVLLLMDEPVFAGCVVQAHLIGVIEADQTEAGNTERNDRLIAVATHAHNYSEVQSLDQLSSNLLDEITHFFVSYNMIKNKQFKPRDRNGPERAKQLVAQGMQRAKKHGKR